MKIFKIVSRIVIVILIAAALAGGWYFAHYYRSIGAAQAALADSDEVDVTKLKGAYFFDGKGDDAVLVFYQGAKVDEASYAPLMKRLAEQGIDCFLCRMPLNFALFNIHQAEKIRDKYSDGRAPGGNDYEKWYIGGHSLGGAAAAMLAKSTSWDGLVLLAAYPTGRIDEPMLSIYGTEDKVLDLEKYESARSAGFWPEASEELIIQGGNHAQFGSYGPQEGDGEAEITAGEQQEETAAAIIKFFGNIQ